MMTFRLTKQIIICVILFVLFEGILAGRRGFILTSPKILKTGTIQHLTLTLYEIPEGGLINIRLLNVGYDDVISETKIFAQSDHSIWVELFVPSVPVNKARLQIKSKFNLVDGYEINGEKIVHLEHNSLITFIQTDKPIYKPGQTVRFRVFPVNTFLEPIDSTVTGDLWIENPSGIRLAQWKNISYMHGIVQLDMPLSREPPLGDWTIHSNILGMVEKQTFEVAKYVLPRFEVTIDPPSYILHNVSTITLKICARYTYGKNVDGIMRLHITLTKYSWEKTLKDASLPSVEIEQLISGCNDVTVQVTKLLQELRYRDRDLEIYAEVKENGTNIIENSTINAAVHRNNFVIDFLELRENKFFKPGLPYHGKIKVTSPDGNPVSQHSIKVCTNIKGDTDASRNEHTCKHFSSDENGQVHFVIPPQRNSTLDVTVEANSENSKGNLLLLKPWYSPSNSYIQITPPSNQFSCNKQEYVKVQYTMFEESRVKFYHQIISRGIIVQQGSHWRTFNAAKDKIDETNTINKENLDEIGRVSNNTWKIGEFLLTFNSRSFMSPVARLLVFYVKSDGEIIADSQELQINRCLPNKVKLKFRQAQQYPGTETSLHLEANVNSFCGIKFVDKSVHLMKSENQMTVSKVFDLLKKHDLNKNSGPQQDIGEYCERWRRSSKDQVIPVYYGGNRHFPIPLHYRENRRLHRSRMFPTVDRPTSFYVDAIMAFEEAGMVVLSDLILETRPCHRMFLDYGMNNFDFMVENMEVPVLAMRTNVVPEVNPSQTQPIPKSVSLIRSYFPETWLWELHSVGEIGEVILKHKLPDTITEWVGNAVCINKVGLGISDPVSIVTFQPFFVSIVLPYSVIRGEKAPVIVSVFNYLSDCLPIKLSLEPSEDFKIIGSISTHKICVCGNKSVTRRFMIKPIVLGNVTITIYGNSLDDDIICKDQITARLKARDAATRKLLVEPEGFYKEKTQSVFFCPKDYHEETFVEQFNLSLPDNLVKGSESAYFSVTGNVMGPSLKSLDKLVRLPVGCGEQNMVLFAPNIFVLDYLTSTNRLTNDIKSKTLQFMKTGYQRQLNYRHNDYSYSAFGENDREGSMWLTAFVVKSFAQARRFIFIDEKDLNSSIQWIVNKQFENGCFPSIGTVHHKDMKGGVNKNQNSFTALTAYVVIALLETGMKTSPRIVAYALHCMDAEQNPSSYSLALFVYAASLAKHSLAEKYLQNLKARATYKDNMMYWSNENNPSLSLSIETSGYAILALLQMGGKENLADALSIVRWIVRQRNSNGGFVSTQDTVIALQALAKYAAFVNQTDLDIVLFIKSEDLEHSFTLTSTNQLLFQTTKLPVLPTVLDIDATGDGCALIQADLHYNVHNIPGSDAFYLNVTSTRVGSSACNKPNIKVCFRYKLQGKTSNMAVIEIKMVSGYVPDEWSLQALNEEEDLSLKRHEVNSDGVVFYFNEMQNDEKCFNFVVIRELEVEDTLPAVAKLYDYYEQELTVSVNYTIQSNCSKDLPEIDQSSELENDTAEQSSDELQQSEIEFIDNITILKYIEEEFDIDIEETTTLFPELDKSPEERRVPDTKFVNVNHELDFPDRMEGNAPVAVKSPHLQDDTKSHSGECPLCLDTFPANFNEFYCKSAFVLRITIRDHSAGRMKIIHNLSSYLRHPQSVKVFGTYILHPSCVCRPLNKDEYVLIVGSSNDLWNSEDGRHQVQLDSGTLVVSTPKNIIQPQTVKTAREICSPVKM